MDVKQFYFRVAQVRNELPNVSSLFVTSTDAQEDGGKPGAVSEVVRELACTLIAKRIARVSTPEEIDKFHADQRERGRIAAEAELRNRQMNPESMAMMASAMASALTGAQSSAVGGEGRRPNK